LSPRGHEGRVLVSALSGALARSPANFEFECQIEQLPAVMVVWEAVFPTAAYAQFRLGREVAAAGVFLSGAHRGSDEAIIGSAREVLANLSRANLDEMFATIQRHPRPVSATIALVDEAQSCKAVRIACAALTSAFFDGHLGIAPAEHSGRIAGVA